MSLTLDCKHSLQPQIWQQIFSPSRFNSPFEIPESVAYWAYHMGRMGFFTAQGIAGISVGLHPNFVHTIERATSITDSKMFSPQ
jgi:hypothetical protein